MLITFTITITIITKRYDPKAVNIAVYIIKCLNLLFEYLINILKNPICNNNNNK